MRLERLNFRNIAWVLSFSLTTTTSIARAELLFPPLCAPARYTLLSGWPRVDCSGLPQAGEDRKQPRHNGVSKGISQRCASGGPRGVGSKEYTITTHETDGGQKYG